MKKQINGAGGACRAGLVDSIEVSFSTAPLRSTNWLSPAPTIEMQIHRIISKDYVPQLLQGAFRFVRLRYYRMLEVVFEDSSIGDAHEGVASTVVTTTISPESYSDPVHQNLVKSGVISVSGNSRIEIKDMTIRNEIDCFVSCWSTSQTPDLAGGGVAYDACVTCKGAKSLAYYLGNYGVERESGKGVRELFRPIASGRVQYLDLQHDFAKGPMPSGEPFRKRTRYRQQSEYRFVFVPLEPINRDFLWVDCQKASELLKETPFQRAANTAADVAAASKPVEDYQQTLDVLLRKWRNLQSQLSVQDDLEREAFRVDRNSAFDAQKWRAIVDASFARRKAVQAEYDRDHLKQLRRCLFELRKPPLNDCLDRALARGELSERLIMALERPLWM